MNQTGLVLEGGGMRGVFTSGVLEYLLESHIEFPYVIGVSAGACNAASYISRQKGRNRAVTVGYAEHPDYISYRRLLRHGELFNMDLIFDQIPNIENPFDYSNFFRSHQNFYIGVTDCVSGGTLYYEKEELREDINKILRASSSLPFVAPPIEYDGKMLMDGGLSDPVPVIRSEKDGNDKNVIILTQKAGYRKTPAKRGMWYFRKKYRSFPGLVNIVENRYLIYNQTLDYIHKLEKQGRAFVLRPQHLHEVTRAERKRARLEDLYGHGYELMKKRSEELEKFLAN